jgi:hypothetical protein
VFFHRGEKPLLRKAILLRTDFPPDSGYLRPNCLICLAIRHSHRPVAEYTGRGISSSVPPQGLLGRLSRVMRRAEPCFFWFLAEKFVHLGNDHDAISSDGSRAAKDIDVGKFVLWVFM